jgi:hypothetical protein
VPAVDRAALFLNLLQLFFISLLPFTTAILGRYPDEAAAVIVYAIHLELLGLAQYAHWVYILRDPELVHAPIDARTERATNLRILLRPIAWAGRWRSDPRALAIEDRHHLSDRGDRRYLASEVARPERPRHGPVL